MSKLISKGLHNELLSNSLESVKVLAINELVGKIEIVYQKNNETQYLSIVPHTRFHSYYKCYFTFDDKALEDSLMLGTDIILGLDEVYKKQTHPLLEEIAYIHTTSYDKYYYDDKDCKKQMQCESITIIATTKESKLKAFTLHFEEDEEANRFFTITSRELKHQFYSKLLRKEEDLVVSLHLDKNYITRFVTTKSLNDDGSTSRLHTPAYTDTLKENSKSKICLVEKEDYFYIEGIGLNIMDKEHYVLMDDEDKALFHTFTDEAVLFLSNLFVNKTFKNAYTLTFESDESYKSFSESLKDKGYTIEQMYSNAEMSRPASLEVFRVFKKEEELKMVVANDWLGEYEVSLEYDKKVGAIV